MHTLTQTHTHTYTDTNTHIHTHTQTHIHTHTDERTHIIHIINFVTVLDATSVVFS